MGILSILKSAFGKKQTDIESRFDFSPKWIQGSGGRFHIVREKTTSETYGLKLIDPVKAKQFRDKFTESFPSEAEIATSLKHPNIVAVHEIGQSTKGNPFILMEYVPGPRLDELIARSEPLIADRAIAIIRQLASALLAVHESQFIHRDFCPRNILFDAKAKNVKLFDFSLTVPNKDEFRQPKNRTGTPLYMAPEIVRRRTTDLGVDLFAFGVTVYQVVTFAHPWGAEENSSKSAMLFDSRSPTDIREHRADFPAKLAEGIMSCLAVDPAKRCNSVKRFLMNAGLKAVGGTGDA